MINWDVLKAKSETFKKNKPFSFMFVQGAIKQEVYDKLVAEWPSEEKFRLFNEVMKRVHVGPSKIFKTGESVNMNFPELSETWNEFANYVASEEYIKNLSEITGMKLTQLTEFGLLEGKKGDFVHPHIDEAVYNQTSSLYYFTKDWKREFGGATCILTNDSYDNVVFEPNALDNNYLLFHETNNAWHGYKRIRIESPHRKAVIIGHG